MARTRTAHPHDSPQPPAEIESPIPRRKRAAQNTLTRTLLKFPRFAERFKYLLEHESRYYTRGDEVIVDPVVISSQRDDLTENLAQIPYIAHWVERRTGQAISKQALYKFRNGELRNPRSGLTNALEAFWRLEHLLLDPTVPPSHFPDDTADAANLDDLEKRTYELMSELGFRGVRPREVKDSLGTTGIDQRRAFVEVLEAIARDRAGTQTPPE